MCSTMCTLTVEPSEPVRWNVPVLCSTEFFWLSDTPNQVVKRPEADTPPGWSGVTVTVPANVPVAQNSPSAWLVAWTLPFLAIPVSIPCSPVHGFTVGSEKSTSLLKCSVIVSVPAPLEAASAEPPESKNSVAESAAPLTACLSIWSLSLGLQTRPPPDQDGPLARSYAAYRSGQHSAPLIRAARTGAWPARQDPFGQAGGAWTRVCHGATDACARDDWPMTHDVVVAHDERQAEAESPRQLARAE